MLKSALCLSKSTLKILKVLVKFDLNKCSQSSSNDLSNKSRQLILADRLIYVTKEHVYDTLFEIYFPYLDIEN